MLKTGMWKGHWLSLKGYVFEPNGHVKYLYCHLLVFTEITPRGSGVKNTFDTSVYSAEYTFIFLLQSTRDVPVNKSNRSTHSIL
jgi:hypothetical protein